MATVILDIGSTHMGDTEQAHIALKKAWDCGADIVKFQFCHPINGNIPLDMKILPDLKIEADCAGIRLMCSVWDFAGIDALSTAGIREVKFAHSMRNEWKLIQASVPAFDRIYITSDFMHIRPEILTDKIKWLYTYEINGVPVYPVTALIDFRGIREWGFSGFSSHAVDPEQLLHAYHAGLEILEWHVNFNPNAECPDARFALTERQTTDIIRRIRDAS